MDYIDQNNEFYDYNSDLIDESTTTLEQEFNKFQQLVFQKK